MKSNLIDKLNGMTPLQLSDSKSLGSGKSGEVFRYLIGNQEVALKCFKEESDAKKEHAVYEKILSKVSQCPGII